LVVGLSLFTNPIKNKWFKLQEQVVQTPGELSILDLCTYRP
jgi:hypothetical protein